jgi:hypothetical protein
MNPSNSAPVSLHGIAANGSPSWYVPRLDVVHTPIQ